MSASSNGTTRYFVRSRHLAAKVAGGRVNIAFREMTAAEAEPHLRTIEKREAAHREACLGLTRPLQQGEGEKS